MTFSCLILICCQGSRLKVLCSSHVSLLQDKHVFRELVDIVCAFDSTNFAFGDCTIFFVWGIKDRVFTLKMSDIQSFAVIYLFLAGFCCSSMGVDQCIPAEGYKGCACYRETVNKTKEYVNLLPLKTNSSTPRYVSLSDSCNLRSVFVSKRGSEDSRLD